MVKKISKTIKVAKEEISEVPVIEEVKETVSAAVVESAEKAAFRLFIENYKVSNPVKYEMKKVALEEKLNEIK